ncbi:MAG TPA: LuxR C-terminal-related transcriptional regulator [Solirubrobacterales bacterium]|nr:LuxR C-terminal-related transcriptional regulator [Solirubrobacterales bacterium]
MTRLSAKDLRAALDFVGDAYSFGDLDEFRHGILPGLERLVPSDLVGYNEVYSATDPALVITYPDPPLEIAGETLGRLAHQHPLISVQANGDDRTYKISDFLSRREFHALELYDELYRVLGAEDQIAVGLPGPLVIGIAMNRSRRDFSERDRAMLELLRPHLARAYDQVLQRMQLQARLGALEDDLAERGAVVLALDRGGDIAAASGSALELLAAYFPETRRSALPVEVVEWLAGGAAASPLTTETGHGRLRVRAADGGAEGQVLILEESRAVTIAALRTLGLTRRQAEVLRLLAAERGTGEIADALFISPQTVRKHLEHIYARLGVHSREAAVTAARETAKGDRR